MNTELELIIPAEAKQAALGSSKRRRPCDMTTEEYLSRIAARCRELLKFDAVGTATARAGWRVTIAAIELNREWEDIHNTWDWDCGVVSMFEAQKKAIIAAWPEELL